MYIRSFDDKLILFSSNPDFSDNPRALWEYITQHTDMKTYWIVKDTSMQEQLSQKGIPCGMMSSEDALEHYHKAKYMASSHLDLEYWKKKGQVALNLWHGMPLKAMAFHEDTDVINNGNALTYTKISGLQTDIFPVTSKFMKMCIATCFALDPRKAQVLGMARNDLIFQPQDRELLGRLLNIDTSRSKFILYTPTMHKSFRKEGMGFDDNLFNMADYDPALMDKVLEKHDAYLVVKLHFADEAMVDTGKFTLPQRAILLKSAAITEALTTLYHVLNCFDALITDYSSLYFDYMLTGKPILFSCADMEAYTRDRGFVVDDPETIMPGPIAKTFAKLVQNMDEALENPNYYAAERTKLMPLIHRYHDGNSCARIYDAMLKAAEQGSPDATLELGDLFTDPEQPLAQYAEKANARIKEQAEKLVAEVEKYKAELNEIKGSRAWGAVEDMRKIKGKLTGSTRNHENHTGHGQENGEKA